MKYITPIDVGMTTSSFYIASKTVHAPYWKLFRSIGVPIISTWIDEAGVGETSDFSDLWTRCISEASSCSKLVCYRESDEILKGAFIEIGAALSHEIPVIAVGDFDGLSFLHHPLVSRVSSLEKAFGIPVSTTPQPDTSPIPVPYPQRGSVERGGGVRGV